MLQYLGEIVVVHVAMSWGGCVSETVEGVVTVVAEEKRTNGTRETVELPLGVSVKPWLAGRQRPLCYNRGAAV